MKEIIFQPDNTKPQPQATVYDQPLTFIDKDGRIHFTKYGAKIYCSSQAMADTVYRLEMAITQKRGNNGF